MLDKKSQTIVRKQLLENRKQLTPIQTVTKKSKKKQRLLFFTTCVLFTAVALCYLLLFVTVTPNKQLQAPTNEFAVETIVEATYLSNERSERMLDLTSPFYRERIEVKGLEKLEELSYLFRYAPTTPFTGDLAHFASSEDYLIEFANGDSVYLKAVYYDLGLIFINPVTMQQYSLTEVDLKKFNRFWLDAFIDLPSDTWKIAVLLLAIISLHMYQWYTKKEVEEDEFIYDVPRWVDIPIFILFAILLMCLHYFIGAMHLGVMLIWTNVYFLGYGLFDYTYRTQVLYKKEFAIRLLFLNSLLLVYYY